MEIDHAGKAQIQRIIGLEYDEIGAFLLGLPKHLSRFDAKSLRFLGFSEHDAVARFSIAAHRNAFAAQFRPVQYFNARIAVVDIRMQNTALRLHLVRHPFRYKNYCSYNEYRTTEE